MDAQSLISTVLSLISFAFLILFIAGKWKAFSKAGLPGWSSIIPVYETYQQLKIGGLSKKWIWVILSGILIGFFGIIGVALSTNLAGIDSIASVGVGLVTLLPLVLYFMFQVWGVISAVINYRVSRSFGKGLAFALGLSVLPFIFWPILGFGKAKYVGVCPHPCEDCETVGKKPMNTSSDAGASEEDMYTDLQS